MPVLKMFIDKFHGVVMIDSDHPLAVAQRARNAAAQADTQSASAPAAQEAPAPARVTPVMNRSRKRSAS
jgi:hypothetical protein